MRCVRLCLKRSRPGQPRSRRGQRAAGRRRPGKGSAQGRDVYRGGGGAGTEVSGAPETKKETNGSESPSGSGCRGEGRGPALLHDGAMRAPPAAL